MRGRATCSGSSRPARGSLASRSPTAAPTASSMWQSCPGSAAGPARSSPASWMRAIPRRPLASRTRCATCPITRTREARCMSSRFPDIRHGMLRTDWVVAVTLAALVLTVAGMRATGAAPSASSRVLRVCADPNNLPFSNEKQQGFENRLAELIAGELDARLEYTWWAQRRGFIRSTLNEGLCDVVMEVPGSFDLAAVTRPYYRSTYVFVYRKDAGLTIRSFDDSLLRSLRIGVQIIGDDYANTPPAHA